MSQIYGIDLSKEKFDVNFINPQGEIVESEVKNKYSDICNFLSSLPDDALLCIEHTGVYGDLLVFLSNSLDISICAIPGYEIKHSSGLQKGKSDPIDAAKIRKYGERFPDKLTLALDEEEDLHELRELHNLRHLLVKSRKTLITQQKEKSRLPYKSLAEHSFAKEMLEVYDVKIKDLENQIQGLINMNPEYAENAELITSVKGIGAVTANELIIKTHNFKKIDTARKAASFAGICPFPNSSGKMIKKARISSFGDKSLKTLLYLCATSAIAHNKSMKHYYQRKKEEGKPSYLVLNNVANKLLRTIYAIIESKQLYDVDYLRLDPRMDEKNVA